MSPRLFGFAVSMMLTACVSTPKGAPSVSGSQGGGYPLAASEVVALFLSTSLVPSDSKQVAGSAPMRDTSSIRPVQDKSAAYKALTEGFLAARSDVQVVVADEPLRQACFQSGNKFVTDDRAVFVLPDVDSAPCRTLINERHLRYFVSFAAWCSIATTTTSEAIGIGFGVSSDHVHEFTFVAKAFDAMSGMEFCDDRTVEVARSREGGAITLLPPGLPFPLFWATTVDEPAYFARAAWLAGAKAGMCFVAPTKAQLLAEEEAKARAQIAPAPHEWCRIEGAGPKNQVWMTAEDCARAKQTGAKGFGTELWCLADPQANQPLCYFTTYEACFAAKITQQYRCILRE